MNESNPDTSDRGASEGSPLPVKPSADIALGKPVEKPDEGQGFILCPYCGHIQKVADRCHDCGGLFEPLSRMATQIHMGPWFVRDKHMPFKPGCSYDVLVKQVKAGKIKRTTVLRGPSTCQFWALARNVPGIAHHLGVCHACNMEVDPSDTECAACRAKFEPVPDRNELGLMYRTPKEHMVAKKVLDREVARMSGQPMPEEEPSATGTAAASTGDVTEDPAVQAHRLPGLDLLDEVVGRSAATDQHTARPSPPNQPASPSPTQSPATSVSSSDSPLGGTNPGQSATAQAAPPAVAQSKTPGIPPAPATSTPGPAAPPAQPSRSPDRTAPLPHLHPQQNRQWNKVFIAFLVINIIALLAVGAAVYVLLQQSSNTSDGPVDNPPPPPPEQYEPQLQDEPTSLYDTNRDDINPYTGKERNLSDTPTEAAPEPASPDEAAAPQSRRISPRMIQRNSPAEPASPINNAAANVTRDAPTTSGTETAGASQNKAAPSQPTPAVTRATENAPEADNQIALRAAARLAQAKRLEQQGRYEQALALLEDAHGALPEVSRPASLDLAIMRIRNRIAQQKAEAFFGSAL